MVTQPDVSVPPWDSCTHARYELQVLRCSRSHALQRLHLDATAGICYA